MARKLNLRFDPLLPRSPVELPSPVQLYPQEDSEDLAPPIEETPIQEHKSFAPYTQRTDDYDEETEPSGPLSAEQDEKERALSVKIAGKQRANEGMQSEKGDAESIDTGLVGAKKQPFKKAFESKEPIRNDTLEAKEIQNDTAVMAKPQEILNAAPHCDLMEGGDGEHI
jgi:hypothetical protein